MTNPRAVLLIAAFSAMTIGAQPVLACPEVDRLIAPYQDGQISTLGGAVPNGARAADDFRLPLGNGANYNVRHIKFVMVSNFPVTLFNTGFVIYNNTSNGSYSIPGSVAAGTPNVFPTVRDLGLFADPAFRMYEVSYAIPAGFLTLAPDRSYWLSPRANAPVGGTGVAYVAVPDSTTVVGAIACKSFGISPGTALGPWSNIEVCCIGARDLAIYVNAVQVGGALSDVNCDLVVSPQDLFDFLGSWFRTAPTADINATGDISVQDIFDFLALWFTGA